MLIGTVYSEFYGFFDGLKGVGPEEAVGLSAAETLRKQFRTAYPHRPEEDLLLADTSFRAPTIKYVRSVPRRAERCTVICLIRISL